MAAGLAGPEVRAPAGGPARGGDGLRAARRGARPPRLRPRRGQEVHHAGLQRRDQAETGEQGELKLLQEPQKGLQNIAKKDPGRVRQSS